jgi:uncharacterized protein YbjT (DUF2867 family)
MKVAIIGGHGKIALKLTSLLNERGDTIRSIIRKAEESDDIRSVGGDPIVCDIESTSSEELAGAVGNVDAVVFAAGAGAGSGPERKETVDHGGAVKLIEAAKMNDIDRYVMISSIGANASAPGDDTFAIYLRAKGRADDALMESGLAYTIVRPTSLTDDAGDGRVHIADRIERNKIPRDDVAAVLDETLHLESTSGKLFELGDGDEPITEALGNL